MTTPIRVGIDVGGTFTDAVAIDATSLELIGTAKVLTTHRHPDGVARGIINALKELLENCGRSADDVVFLAHGTTQATNALLEGDVATVGVVGLGRGLDGWRTRSVRHLSRLELAPGKHLPLAYAHATAPSQVPGAVAAVHRAGAEVVVGVEAFSVDDPDGELAVVHAAESQRLPATATHDISKLYGLKKRARTAALNASILPRMLGTAELVRSSIDHAGIHAPLMVMRCDGGVMSLDEMRRRPLLTILSGPAAGAAGALLAERVSESVFLETGGTSTDISVIRDGRVAVSYAKVGGYTTYLKSLDVRTVGIGGGSLVRVSGGRVADVGPRSAHIAGLDYGCFADPELVRGGRLELERPMEGDPADYAVVVTDHGRFAITVTCAANALGIVPRGDYAFAEPAAARLAIEPLAARLRYSVDDAARQILDRAAGRVREVVDELIKDYRLERDGLELVGGGGGAATVALHLGSTMDLPARIAANSSVISPIGVALALVRDTVERVIPEPNRQDILSVRAEAERAVLAQGASPATIEVDVSVDPQRNVVAAVATGATDLHTPASEKASEQTAADAAARSMRVDVAAVRTAATTPQFRVYTAERARGGLIGRVSRPRHPVRVVDSDGLVRFTSPHAEVRGSTVGAARAALTKALDEFTAYGDSGARVPAIHLLVAGRLVNLAGVTHADQVLALADTELSGRADEEDVVLVVEERS
ncbi:hydantoinase/oxoprolinase family protein [Pseudonocardia sp. DSM 110487]|uniref:hydantoinase/oxoprolinase family protein n=1 Tax=Pseudonocardia sp. DSM 110487 TaxID=2865833 RepID=UPI001C695839|nr:hydantoinase/oxoprolinase family protein [Pseudonocardia sp. DSM 110487]QYN32222.1 hydantoinase/oxoprolinase family protein [Pseudonocardia sp. DSM 110487]